MVPVVIVGVSVHQEFQASQEALDPRDQQVSRDHLQAQQVHVGTKVKQVQLVPLETRVIQVLVEVKVPQVQRVLQDRFLVIGNNAFLRIWTMEGTPDW